MRLYSVETNTIRSILLKKKIGSQHQSMIRLLDDGSYYRESNEYNKIMTVSNEYNLIESHTCERGVALPICEHGTWRRARDLKI